ncbi:hypothetical protein GGU11DRAFT_794823 [Lentinula aff. detonsa]|uniref:Shugoshin C-terminal domain-containing protein n=1 Tax=Lentinula aff. detonsa TaxID=2804958 RepID=A0AA38KQ16_9AGAR|nr:hypothetical protein GGU10DRAFT_389720 [Lentinula aff. detonsa]KAJ3794782.1 hypothetical protein GGU11DRAFT_794823 [Lentinula aff. detonsa]
MSKRESRVSMNARQNDALFEFENFKKKFLLANKHITKLNSTLSVRIEELNAQISTLYTENIRLRASEINLAAQLKREREKSRKVIAETEAAALGLTKHLSFLRQAFCILEQAPSSSSSPTPPRATQRPLPSADSLNSPVYPRLSRAPTIPLIYEDDEPSDPTEDEDVIKEKTPSPRRKHKVKRLSASRLPLPSRMSSPPPVAPLIDHFVPATSNSTKRKSLRRHSGLLVRQGSPVVGSHEAEETDEAAADLVEPEEKEVLVVRKEKRKVSQDKSKEREHDVSLRKKLRDEMGDEGKNLKLADVTNSPRNRPSQPVDAVVSEVELEVARISNSRREFLSSSPPRSSSGSQSSPTNYLPTPEQSLSPPHIPATINNLDSQPELALISGRERRVRKSVNYAEPKLNTKMRKPPSESAGNSSRKRKSASAVMSSRTEERIPGNGTDVDADYDDTDGGARSSLEGPGSQSLRNHATDAAQFPLPASRPGSSADMMSQPLASASSTTTSMPSRRANARLYLYTAEDDLSSESDDDADTEYVPSSGAGKGSATWVNMSARKKGDRRVAVEEDGARRHSSAV